MTLLLLLLSAVSGNAQWVSVDPAFPAGGQPDYYVRTLAVTTGGRLLIAGMFTNVGGLARPYLARLDTNGAVDAAFAPQFNAEPRRIQPLPEGRILICGGFTNVNGQFRPGLARLLEDGSTDAAFIPPAASTLTIPLTGIASPDGAVIVAGSFTNLGGQPRHSVARLLATGVLDPSFQSPFPSGASVTLLAVQADGKPIVSGSFTNLGSLRVTNLVRLNLDGSVDTAFQSGLAPNERISRALLQPDDRLLATVASVGDYGIPTTPQRLVRLHTNGKLDATFNVTLECPGLPYSGGVYGMTLHRDGRILLIGNFLRVNGTPRAKIARLEPDGRLDYCFDLALGDELMPLAVDTDAEGNVVLGGVFSMLHGQWHPYLLRLLPPAACAPGVIEMATAMSSAREDAPCVIVPVVRHGRADLEQTVQFTTRDGTAQGGADIETVSGTLHFAPGKRSGFIRIPLLRDALAEGTETFEVALSLPGNGASLGLFTNTVVTLEDALSPGTAGAPDTNYIVQLDGPVQVILPLADGSAVIGGTFTNVNALPCPSLARLRPDGSRDTRFARAQPLNGEVLSLALDAAGRLLVAGHFGQVDGIWQPGLARFETNGTLDATFTAFRNWPTNEYATQMESVAVLADGSIVCGGYVPVSTGYSTRAVMLRLFESGEMDSAFTNQLSANVSVQALTPLPNGDFLLVGDGLGNSLVQLHADGTLNYGFIPPADRPFVYNTGDHGLLPDGRIMVGGYGSTLYSLPNQPPLWRLNPDGSEDPGFALPDLLGSPGTLQAVNRMAAAADGRVVVAGSFSGSAAAVALARLHTDGALDLSFDSGRAIQPITSTASASVNALVALPSGGWLVGGSFGSYDGFNQRHLVKILPETLTRPLTFQLTVTNLIVSETNGPVPLTVTRRGDASGNATVTLHTVNGTATGGQDFGALDVPLDFAPGEWSKTTVLDIVNDSLIESPEQFIVLFTNATAGFSLSPPSLITVQIQSDDASVEFVADQFPAHEEDGYVLAGVKWSGAISTGLRAVVNVFPPTGHEEDLGVDSLWVQYGTQTRLGTNWFRIPIVDDAQHESPRTFRLALAGSSSVLPGLRSNAWLVLDDLDFATSPARGVAGVVETMANAPDGGVYLAGDFTGVHGVPRNRVARLLPDGEVDLDFSPGAGPNSNVTAVAVQPDGKVVIAGDFTAVADLPRAGVARLNADGSPDSTFDPGLGPTSTNGIPYLRALLPQPDGSVFVGGAFTHFNQRYGRSVARLRFDGSVDDSFQAPFVSSQLYPRPLQNDASVADELATQTDGGLLVAGRLNVAATFGGVSGQAALVRLTGAGSYDPTFTKVSPSLAGTVHALALLPDGRILTGGSATTNWIPIRRFGANGILDASFQVRNAPQLPFYFAEVRQLLVEPDGRILFSTAIYTGNQLGSSLDRGVIGRLLPDGAWDSCFELVDCALPLLETSGPFWFNTPAPPFLIPAAEAPVPTVTFARQPNGVLVLAGIFDSVNGEPRRRLARLESNGAVRGRLALRLHRDLSLRLLSPAEVETPYVIETSTDLDQWSGWLLNTHPWWPVELWLPSDEPARFFRARPSE